MDIDDILQQVDPTTASIPPETRDLQALTRAWIAERSAPELLEWPPDNLFERVNARIARQIETIEDMTGDMDPKTNFALIVIQTELERFKFLVRSYIRARIAKVPLRKKMKQNPSATPSSAREANQHTPPHPQIDKHTLYYLASPALRARLSPTELAYATRHQALLHDHYLSSFLSSFPPQLQNLNDTAGMTSMIDGPDLDAAVFVRLLRDATVEGRGTDSDDAIDARFGDVLILRWSSARGLVDTGVAELA
ncbi:GINS complex subunit [Verticillium nonalfalfae]|uniref:DNA replication complex GINS protein SLD5 n=1 Tax=Verticillium nonalfalfae TaxID=1051616 RepID=A0A3M9YM73_9PEZI|nr:GINS complex subunit [Verticillium nonalfalfae]RNJ60866.1 GINS complex subunit [Verticillium nonalfalfae]